MTSLEKIKKQIDSKEAKIDHLVYNMNELRESIKKLEREIRNLKK